MSVDWDPPKAARNRVKHGIAFEEAATVFLDVLAGTDFDAAHATPEEPRWLTVGRSERGRLLIVWHTTRNGITRIIGARLATPSERRRYEEAR